MNKRFFNQQNLTRRLRMLFVLFAMLLLPLGAWAEDYPLIVAGVQVTDENATGITGTGITTGTVSFTPASGDNPATLTLNSATINGDITYSGTEDLTIAFSGTTNAVSTSENYAIQYVGSDSELPNLAFSLTNGSTTGSLNLSSENCVISGFSDVDFGNLNLASASAQGVYYDSSEYGYHMAGCGGNPNNLTITTETYHPIWIYDPSLGEQASHTQLNSNKLSVAFGEGTVSFDGNHTITMNNVNFNYEDNTLIVVGPGMEELTVNLVGTSTVRSGSIFLSLWATTPLTFTTDESNPGSLTAPTIVSWNNSENGQITYQNGLVFNFDESTYKGTISTTGDRLKIGDISINATGDITGDGITGTVHFDTSNNTLTLTGATIGDATAENNIQVFVDNLKVSINGSNTIFGNIIYEGNNIQSSTIQINKASDASTANLTVSGISDFGNCSWSDGIYLSAVNSAGNPTDIHYESYENEGGGMESYSGDFSTITFSTTKPIESIWIGETQVGANGSFSGIEGVSFDSVNKILTLNNADLQSKGHIISSLPCLTIELTGENGARNGRSDLGENKYIISTDPSATLTFTTDGNNSLCSTIDNYDFPWKGFAGNPTFENKLVLLQAAGTMSIEVLQAPTMSYASGNLSFDGLSDGYNNKFDCYYSITYEDGNGNIAITKYEPGEGDQPNPVSMVEKPCTVTAYVTYKDRLGNTTQSETAIGKYFGPAENPMRLVYGADPVDLVLAPTIEENDGIKINGIEANVTYNSTTGKVSSETMGSHGAVVSLGYQDETIQTTLLNNYFNMSFDVVPPAPTIGLAEGTYSSTQENITITSDGLANTTIKYQWDEGEIKDYPATGGVPFQAGTLKAWVVYTSGETPVSSDIVSATYTLLRDPGLDFVVGDNPVEEDVNYTIGGSSNPTLPTLQKPEGVTVTYASSNTGVATVATDGTVTPVGVGYTTITATSTATSEYEAGEASYTLNVYKDLSHSSITVEVANVTYNGQAKTPTVTVKDGDKVLMYGEDNGGGTLLYEYKVEYANNTNAGLATAETGAPTVTVTAYTDDDYSESHMEVTHYRGSTTKTFTISPMSISTATVSVDATQTYTYTGSEIKPSVSVSIYLTENAENITTLTEGTDYTVTGYANNTNAATATSENAPTITITGKGNFTGTATGTFTIAQAKLSVVTIAPIADQAYTGDQITPAVTVTFNDAAVSTEDYNVVYGENTNAGENAGTVTLTSKNKNFVTSTDADATTKQTATFNIVAATAAITATDQTVTFDGEEQPFTNYTIANGEAVVTYYSSEEARTAKTGGTTNAPTNAAIYYVQVTQGDDNYTSAPANATFTISPKALTEGMVEQDGVSYTYSGYTPEYSVSVKDGEEYLAGDDYDCVIKQGGTEIIPVNAGSYDVVVTGKRNYTGTITKTLTITKAQLTVTPDDKTYNVGDNIELTVSYDGFVDGDDEDVLTTEPTASYGTADVTKPGSYTITVSGGVAQNYDFVYETGTLTINRVLDVSFASNTWATYCGTENLATPEGLQAYIVTAVGTSAVTTSAIDYIPANTAVLLKYVSGNKKNISASAYTEATSTFESNILKGKAEDVSVSSITGGTVYILINNMFRRATGTIPARRGYLVVNSSNAPQLSITIGDDTTGIGTAGCDSVATDNDEWYSIDGMKLNGQPQKPGLYIKNGKKVVINKK